MPRMLMMVMCGVLAVMQCAVAGTDDALAALKRGDINAAFGGFLEEANKGNPQAQNQVGVMYRDGRGVAIRRNRSIAFDALFAVIASQREDR